MQYITTEEVERVLFRIIESKTIVKDIRNILKITSGMEQEKYKKAFVEYNFKTTDLWENNYQKSVMMKWPYK